MLKLKSELVSNVLKILLWTLVFLGGFDVAAMLVYASSIDAFINNVYGIYGFIEVITYYLYLIVLIVYLVWIYRVHMDLQSRFPAFPRSPRMSLVFNIVPILSLYGVPSTYTTIGNHFATNPRLEQEGRIIHRLALPLLILLLIVGYFNRYIAASDEVSANTLLLASIAQFCLYCIFLQLCLKISQGLEKTVVPSSAPNDDTYSETIDGSGSGF